MCKTERINGEAAPASVPSNSTPANKSPAPQQHGLAHLAMCALGICICYLYYGILQERLFTGRQRLGASFILVTQCITNAVVALVWQRIEARSDDINNNQNDKEKKDIKEGTTAPSTAGTLNHVLLFLTSGFYVAAMACSNEAVQYVSYPVAVLAKSCKLIPTMLVGQVIEGKLYSSSEWAAALLISAGIVLFHLTRNVTKAASGADDDQSTYGMTLLLCSLGMDGVLSSCQNYIKFPRNKQHRPPSAVETMLYINMYAVAYLLPMCVYNGQWADGVARLSAEDSLVVAVLILNATVALGQIFIFLCITWFSPVVTTTITTTRKFLTIVVSVLTFGHSFTPTQWLAVLLVFSGLYLIIAVQKAQKRASKKTKSD